jgi:DNA-binding response OmpR family regulator
MLKWARVLIIEDELLVAWSLHDVLSLIGCEVTGIAATVSEALILAENTKPDLALVDVRLAGQQDGIEGAVLLRKQFGLPVIFLTGEVERETAWRAAEVGPVEYLVKPVHTRQLVEAIRTAVERRAEEIAHPNWSSSPNIGDKPRC